MSAKRMMPDTVSSAVSPVVPGRSVKLLPKATSSGGMLRWKRLFPPLGGGGATGFNPATLTRIMVRLIGVPSVSLTTNVSGVIESSGGMPMFFGLASVNFRANISLISLCASPGI
jgi:hypothetical protein